MQSSTWTVAALSRLQHEVSGTSVEYPGRLATCPKGHVRVLPTRFSRTEFDLRCNECGRAYPFRDVPEAVG